MCVEWTSKWENNIISKKGLEYIGLWHYNDFFSYSIYAGWFLYSFSMTAITNYKKHSGLKQQEFFLLWFWRPEVYNQVGLSSFRDNEWRESIRLPFSASRGLGSGSCLHHPNLLLLSLNLFLLTLLLLPPSDKGPWDYIGPTWIMQDTLPISTPLI